MNNDFDVVRDANDSGDGTGSIRNGGVKIPQSIDMNMDEIRDHVEDLAPSRRNNDTQ